MLRMTIRRFYSSLFVVVFIIMMICRKIISHETLLTRIWGYDFEGNEGAGFSAATKKEELASGEVKLLQGMKERIYERSMYNSLGED